MVRMFAIVNHQGHRTLLHALYDKLRPDQLFALSTHIKNVATDAADSVSSTGSATSDTYDFSITGPETDRVQVMLSHMKAFKTSGQIFKCWWESTFTLTAAPPDSSSPGTTTTGKLVTTTSAATHVGPTSALTTFGDKENRMQALSATLNELTSMQTTIEGELTKIPAEHMRTAHGPGCEELKRVVGWFRQYLQRETQSQQTSSQAEDQQRTIKHVDQISKEEAVKLEVSEKEE